MVLRDNFKKYRLFALLLISLMVVGLYGLALWHPHKKKALVKTAKDFSFFYTGSHPFAKTSKEHQVLRQKAPLSSPADAIKVSAESVEELKSIFDVCAYTLSSVRNGDCDIPRLMVVTLPLDMKEKKNEDVRKETFILSLLPMILHANEKISKKRERLMGVKEKATLSDKDCQWLSRLATTYNLKKIDVQELIKRVDTVPPSLFLAQAILETGWGTSHAALRKKSLFGVTLKSGTVKSYPSLQASVEAYIHNLNCNPAYRDMRRLRAIMRHKGLDLCSQTLMGKLLKYCEKRYWYVEQVRDTITYHQLKQFDNSKFA